MSSLIAILQSLIRKLSFAERIIDHFGFGDGLRILFQWKLGGQIFYLFPPGSTVPMALRPRTSDLPMFAQTFIEKQYAFELLQEPLTIVDAGANIGTSSCYFANRFARARIFALEPEPTNYAMLCRNVSHLPAVVPIQAALWPKHGDVQLVTQGRQKSEVEVREISASDGNSLVSAVTIPDLCLRYSLERIDLLKLDIEGAEKALFDAAQSWIERVAVIAIELHERIAPGSTRSFYRATFNFPHELASGENTVVLRDAYYLLENQRLDSKPTGD
jgi:FkbM family methyltransferase